ncbi:MAG: Type secretion system protein virB10 [Rickettsiaceae bacterium]|jgi:type IV secretion system protein VirB10|nr:Type secretion system protein virB10 [Rickettsiaceae bacterium]
MKSKLFKQHKKEQDKGLGQGEIDNDDDKLEVDASDPGVSNPRNNKMLVVVASAILITVVIYFLFFKGEKDNQIDNLEEVKTEVPATSPTSPSAPTGAPAAPENIEDLTDTIKSDTPDVLAKPELPEIPQLPEVPRDPNAGGILKNLNSGTNAPANQSTSVQPGQPVSNIPNQPINQPPPPQDPRRAPIVVESTGSTVLENDQFSGGIVSLKKEPIEELQKSPESIVATVIKDPSTTIVQGKLLTAVLETAINTEVPGSIRGVVSRDVYAEAGNNILIPKGSRLYGTYSTQIVRGQGRVEISWTRLIRPDGVDLRIGFIASDQFGRSGIEGDVDNRYGSVLTNSLLTSVLAIGGAIAAEKLSSNGGQTTTTNSPSTGTTTYTSNPSSKVIMDVSKTLIDTVGQVIGNTIDTRPVIKVPQGTRITVIVNADMSIPPLKLSR